MGAIYAALDRMERKGLSASRLEDAPEESPGRARRYYTVSEKGAAALAESREVRESMWLRLGETG